MKIRWIAICMILALTVAALTLTAAPGALAQEVTFDISFPRESLATLMQSLEGTTISYWGKSRDDLQAARLLIHRTWVTKMGEGKIFTGLEGTIWILYDLRAGEALGIPLGKPMQVNTSVDFSSDLSLIPWIDEAAKKLLLKVEVLSLDLRSSEGFYEMLRLIPGFERIVRSQVNRALQGMRLEILDLSPYMVPQEFSLQESRWESDHLLHLEPTGVKIDIQQDVLRARASARVESRPTASSPVH
jgi:hypothetical protein